MPSTDLTAFAPLDCCEHARERLEQRSIDRWLVRLVLEFGDTEIPVGRGRMAFSISRRGAQALADRGIPPDDLNRAARLVVVAGDGDGGLRIVTAFRQSPRGYRHLRRRIPRHHRPRRQPR